MPYDGDGSGSESSDEEVYTTRHLRSGKKRVPLVVAGRRRGPRKDKNAVVPEQPNRTALVRKSMTNATTERMASKRNKSRHEQEEIAEIIDWDGLDGVDAVPNYRLLDNKKARCHILADSNVKILLVQIIKNLRVSHTLKRDNALKAFIAALNSREADDLYEAILAQVKKTQLIDLQGLAHALSHGTENLFFGDSERNEFILVGFDLHIVDGRPTRESIAIRDAVIGLAGVGLVDLTTAMNATAPTYDRRTNRAVSSSTPDGYQPMDLVDEKPGEDFERASSVDF